MPMGMAVASAFQLSLDIMFLNRVLLPCSAVDLELSQTALPAPHVQTAQLESSQTGRLQALHALSVVLAHTQRSITLHLAHYAQWESFPRHLVELQRRCVRGVQCVVVASSHQSLARLQAILHAAHAGSVVLRSLYHFPAPAQTTETALSAQTALLESTGRLVVQLPWIPSVNLAQEVTTCQLLGRIFSA